MATLTVPILSAHGKAGLAPIAYMGRYGEALGWIVRDHAARVWFVADDEALSVRILDRSDTPRLEVGPEHPVGGLLLHVATAVHATLAIQRH